MRQFIRHPLAIPINVSTADMKTSLDTHNMGTGGLAFICHHKMQPGSLVEVRIPHVQPEFETTARVVWCRDCESGVEMGVEFLTPDDAYRTRMIEQICHIENYRQQVKQEQGRQLSSQEAALEWINKYAASFPKLDNN